MVYGCTGDCTVINCSLVRTLIFCPSLTAWTKTPNLVMRSSSAQSVELLCHKVSLSVGNTSQ